MPKAHNNRLTLWIVIAIVLAVAAALIFPRFAVATGVGGEIFLRLLKMLIVPLVVASVSGGILGMGDLRRLGRPAAFTAAYFLTTTLMAVTLGLVLVNLIEPGVGFDQQKLAEDQARGAERLSQSTVAESEKGRTLGRLIEELLLMLFTDNLFDAAAKGNILPLIVFSILFAGLLTTLGKRVETLNRLIVEGNDALLAFVMMLMKVAPIGIFCLVAGRFGEVVLRGDFVKEVQQVGWYMATVLGGLAFHAFITIPLIYFIVRRRNPYRLMLHMTQAILTAFSTASSSATLPVTIECATLKAKIPKRSVDFVVPLGSTVNMDGTALYEAVAAMFIAQAYGIPLSIEQQAIIAITATLASIGAAGIPEAGLFTMVIVLSAVNLPLEGIGMLLAVDWLLDRFRTATNVWGDSAGSAVVAPAFNSYHGDDPISPISASSAAS